MNKIVVFRPACRAVVQGSAGLPTRETAFALSIRSGPGTDNRIVGYLRQNDEVEVLQTLPDGIWKEIRTRTGLVGWCFSKYLAAVEEESPQPPPLDNPPTTPPSDEQTPVASQYRTTGSLKIRSGPSTIYKVIGYLAKAETVATLAFSTDKAGEHPQK